MTNKHLGSSFEDYLVESLCKDLKVCQEWGNGWNGVVLPVLQAISSYNETNQDNTIEVYQIKEKYARLCVYLSHNPPELDKIIEDAEKASESTCEICGKHGTLYARGWWTIRCDEHKVMTTHD